MAHTEQRGQQEGVPVEPGGRSGLSLQLDDTAASAFVNEYSWARVTV